MRRPHLLMLLIATLALSACAALSDREPIQVTVANIAPLPSEGLEARMLLKLRVQNPNAEPINYEGVSLKLIVQGNTYATGVSDLQGTIPRFGEATIDVPVTVSALRVALQAFGLMRDGKAPDKLRYTLTGRLGGSLLGSNSFTNDGELDLAPN